MAQTQKPIRVLIADDHTIVRSGLRLLLEAEVDFLVVGEAVNGRQAVEKSEKFNPDVILMDITMPDMDGLEATRLIKKAQPETHILALTMHRSEEYFFEMLKSGASGYILKGAETHDLLDALRTVAKGEVFLYPSVAGKLVQNFVARSNFDESHANLLTAREKEVLNLLVEGYTNAEIAEKLVLSASTVYTHRGNIMNKLNLSSRHELIRYARQNGLI